MTAGDKKRTYKLTEIAGKLGITRSTLADWSNQFREFLPTITIGDSLRYTEEAIEIFEIISKMKHSHKSLSHIKDHLKDMRNKELAAVKEEEKPAAPPLLRAPAFS
ncbi:MerR family transcriptional regulator [Paenibacillus sp. P26]|nr:MerR family transcriptional regulator [Paenibacillus sp. P26]UUZ95268.1 MerR family transcriptional regulator [Paenibacillus sp. P25]